MNMSAPWLKWQSWCDWVKILLLGFKSNIAYKSGSLTLPSKAPRSLFHCEKSSIEELEQTHSSDILWTDNLQPRYWYSWPNSRGYNWKTESTLNLLGLLQPTEILLLMGRKTDGERQHGITGVYYRLARNDCSFLGRHQPLGNPELRDGSEDITSFPLL